MKFLIVLATVLTITLAAVKFEAPSHSIPILRSESEHGLDGSYGYEFEAGNGISISEHGKGGEYARGSASWTAPDGTPVFFQYTADENGFQPTGSHVPQIPALILRALEWSRAHPHVEA